MLLIHLNATRSNICSREEDGRRKREIKRDATHIMEDETVVDGGGTFISPICNHVSTKYPDARYTQYYSENHAGSRQLFGQSQLHLYKQQSADVNNRIYLSFASLFLYLFI